MVNMREYWLEPCEHNVRTEYCHREIEESLDDVDELVAIISEALNCQQSSVEQNCWLDAESIKINRRFVFSDLGGRFGVEVGHLNLRELDIEGYLCQTTEYFGKLRDPAVRNYKIEIKNDEANCTVVERDCGLATGSEERKMTPYDAHELMKALSLVVELDVRDPDYVDPDSYKGWASRR